MAELVWRGKATTEREQTRASYPAHLVTTTYYPPQVQETSTHTPEEAHWYNRLIWGDREQILPALRQEFEAAINLIYIDPPFMTGRSFSAGNALAYNDTWQNDLDTYLQWLYETLTQLYQLLAPDGSLYIHLDWRVVHYAKVMLDEIFGQRQKAGFKNEIIWHYQSGGRAQQGYARKHDTILLYTKSEHYCFRAERISSRRGTHKRNHMRKEVDADGHITWTIRSGGRLYTYHEDSPMSPADVWSDISHLHQRDPERTGYATQKPAALLERIILASSEEHDLVLDCFCGSGVTPTVAEQLGRRWIACDKSELAIGVTQQRLLRNERCQPFALQRLAEHIPTRNI
ncbi:MAG TPA: site-specific DNA-methyltransferase [Ktedonobacteraceae bacterium]|nr:site-specific DNA-methyltransferase [Ktedonobacteraceae bacterium]